MDKNIIVSITAIICLTIIFIVASYTMPEASKLFWGIIVIIGGLAGYYIPKAVIGIRNRIRRK